MLRWFAVLLAWSQIASATGELAHSGYLLGASDAPVDGSVDFTFRLFSSPTGPSPTWEASCPVVVARGYYAVRLGADCGAQLPSTTFTSGPMWLEVQAGLVVLTPRLSIATVPLADEAHALGGYAASDFVRKSELSIALPAGGTPGPTTFLRGDGMWAEPTPQIIYTSGSGIHIEQASATNASVSVMNAGPTNLATGDYSGVFTGGPYGISIAGDAASVGGLSASATPTAGQLLPLDATGKFPASVLDTTGLTLPPSAHTHTTETFVRGPAALAATGSTLTSLVADATALVIASAVGTDLEVTSGQTTVLSNTLESYRNVTVRSGGTLTVAAWNGTDGGKLRLRATGTVTVEAGGSITVKGKGYRGGVSISPRGSDGQAGESPAGVGLRAPCTRNGGGGGGGQNDAGDYGEPGAGGGYGTAGTDGIRNYSGGCNSQGGAVYGDSEISTLNLGSGGGSGGTDRDKTGRGGDGGSGGGVISIEANAIVVGGTIDARGDAGTAFYVTSDNGGGGGGSGGSIVLWGSTITVSAGGVVTALGGAGGTGSGANNGGAGGDGRILVRAPTLAQGGTISGGAQRVEPGYAAPSVALSSATYVSPAVAISSAGRLVQVDAFAGRSPETHVALEVCVADSAATSADEACYRPVATSGAVDVASNKAFARVRLKVVERGAPGSFRLYGLRFVTTP